MNTFRAVVLHLFMCFAVGYSIGAVFSLTLLAIRGPIPSHVEALR